MRASYLWAASGLLCCVAGAWAQTRDAVTAQNIATLKKQAASDDANAQFRLGYAYYAGQGVQKDDAKAEIWYRKAANQGLPVAQYDLGILYRDGQGVPQDYEKAAVWFRKAAEQGFADAQCNLGALYQDGHGVQKDAEQAAAWYRKAAEQGSQRAEYDLGEMYQSGEGVPKDVVKAALWHRKSAEQGNPDAAFSLASLYLGGAGVPQDTKEALAWFHKAAEKGHAQSQYLLGQFYEDGGRWGTAVKQPDGSYGAGPFIADPTIPKNPILAANWYRKSADQGYALAQNHLGRLYQNGDGVPQDFSEAYFWLSLGSANGSNSYTDGTNDRDLIAAHLTKAVLLQTQERARKWFEDHSLKP